MQGVETNPGANAIKHLSQTLLEVVAYPCATGNRLGTSCPI
jgi:hypothetical protein